VAIGACVEICDAIDIEVNCGGVAVDGDALNGGGRRHVAVRIGVHDSRKQPQVPEQIAAFLGQVLDILGADFVRFSGTGVLKLCDRREHGTDFGGGAFLQNHAAAAVSFLSEHDDAGLDLRFEAGRPDGDAVGAGLDIGEPVTALFIRGGGAGDASGGVRECDRRIGNGVAARISYAADQRTRDRLRQQARAADGEDKNRARITFQYHLYPFRFFD
jgi:hypothetical protein